MSIVSALQISRVKEGGAAEAAGLESGDVVIEYNGYPIATNDNLLKAASEAAARSGDQATIRILRSSRFFDVKIAPGPLGVELRDVSSSWLEDQIARAKMISARQPPTYALLFARHAGARILLNADDPTKLKEVTLLSASEDFFTVLDGMQKIHYPYSQILQVNESVPDGTLSVLVFHLVVYKGAIGFGFSVPIG